MNTAPDPEATGHARASSVPATGVSWFRALMELPRPINCAIAFFSVLLGGWLGAAALPRDLFIAAASAALITGGGNAFNDLCGLTEDRINKPHRPLPSGRLSLPAARRTTALLLSAGLILGLILPLPIPSVAMIAIIGLAFYNMHAKRVPILGNLIVSALGGLAFFYGGLAAQHPYPAIWPALFAFVFHLGREILKDMEDCAGDRILSGATIPLRWGMCTASGITTGVFVLLMGLMMFPVILGLHGYRYLAMIGLLDILLLYVLIRLWQVQTPVSLRHLSHLLKAGMILGLAAFVIDRL